ncbi:Phosphatidylglycerol/phosphatidylinositol transfer protein [Rhodotorula mucilaginosa]|uniref:Phosphatidylglycerol/phosphatidylinositol transfer protein n=1 Tax=Rhodotorula mucilaginosa TaxID=5537 RepID=A0A9P6W163_RHOMI|nr:Phosphatidylglycerol/phosphatidylinositol transfer protein [Rhodotorula mucilaginosa]
MLLKATAAIALLSSAVLAAPAAVTFDDAAAIARPQVVLSGARQAALNWGADKLSRIGDDDGQAHAMTQWGWSDCGLVKEDDLQIESLEVSPDPPKPGHNLTINASGRKGTSADVTVKLGLIKLLTKRANINSSLACPIDPGVYSFTHTVALPNEIPRAKFQVNARVVTPVVEEEVGCLDLWINFLVPDQL